MSLFTLNQRISGIQQEINQLQEEIIGGGASLTGNNIFTGINTFNNAVNVEGATNINTIADFDTTIGNIATTTKINGAIDLDATSIIARSDLNCSQLQRSLTILST